MKNKDKKIKWLHIKLPKLKDVRKWYPKLTRYGDYDNNIEPLDLETEFKIVCRTEEDREQLLQAFEMIHDSVDIDTDFILMNRLSHLYLDSEQNMVIVNPTIYDMFKKDEK